MGYRPLKILTWNVNSVHARLPRLVALLQRETPDVLCLQELKCTEDRFPTDTLGQLGYTSVVLGQKAYNGVAVCSRIPIDERRLPLKGEGLPDAARIIGARMDRVWIYSVYVPNGQAVGTEKFHYKLSWMRALAKYLREEHEGDPVALCGDFNVAPEDRDVHDPGALEGKLLFSGPEREALTDIVGDRFVDTFRIHEKNGGHYSWWDYRALSFQMNKGLRIDFVLATKDWASRCVRASIDRAQRKGEKPSDHAPVIAEFVS